MGHTLDLVDGIRSLIAPSDTVLSEARERLKVVRGLAETFPGALRTYASGSIAHHTVNHPVSDGDGGLVLNRRNYPALGPDGGGEQPLEVVSDLCALLGPTLRQIYPDAWCGKSKRGPKLWFGAPLEDQDPTVDLVVALTRREGSGLWIPNLETNTWEPSDPEGHCRLLADGTTSLVRKRRQVIRLAKAWNKQYSTPAFSSFHLSVLALASVTSGGNLASTLQAFFAAAATAVDAGDTPDPAGVSAPIRLLGKRTAAVQRLNKAADGLADALANDDETAVRAAVSGVFWKYVEEPSTLQLTSAVAAMQERRPVSTATLGLAGPAVVLASTRAYGSEPQ